MRLETGLRALSESYTRKSSKSRNNESGASDDPGNRAENACIAV